MRKDAPLTPSPLGNFWVSHPFNILVVECLEALSGMSVYFRCEYNTSLDLS